MKIKTIQKLQKVIDEYIQSTKDFYYILETIKDKKIKKILIKYLSLYGALNINLTKYMLQNIYNIIEQKTIDTEFEKLMRQLKNGK